MRIGIDARTMTAPRPRGTGRNLLDAYRLIPTLRPDWEFHLYHRRAVESVLAGDEPWQHANVHLHEIECPGDRFDAWFQLRLPFAARAEQLDLLHLPANAAPAWCPTPFVATIHDLVPLHVEGELPPAETARFRRGVLRAVRRAAHVITPSCATRDELHDEFGVPLERVTVVPWAADQRIASAAREAPDGAEIEALRRKYGLTERWLVAFVGEGKRKNARGIIAGFGQVPEAQRGDVQLVLVGCAPGGGREQLAGFAEQAGVGERCRVLGFVPHEDLAPLLRGARGLVIASLGEGFGLPVLDAFACGTPVLASSIPSLREVAGDAAVYCDPRHPASIAEGMARLLNLEVAQVRAGRGRLRLSLYSWEQTAEAMCRVYEAAGTRRATRRAAVPGGRA